MQSIGDVLSKKLNMNRFYKMVDEIMQHQEIKDFIKENKLQDDEISRSYSKFYEYIKERDRFDNKEQTAMIGYEPKLVMSGRFVEVSYMETEEVVKRRKRAEYLKRLNRNSIILDKTIKKATFDNFKATTDQEISALKFARDIAEYYKKGGEGNTVVSGPAGTGKSHLSMSILKSCLDVDDLSVIFASYSEVLRLIKDSFNNKDSFYSLEYFMEIFRNTDLLVLDDIGSEQITEWSQALLTDVLDGRTKTIITTNLSSDELRKKYNNRIYSRVFRGVEKKAFNFKNIKDKRVSQIPF